MSRKLRDSLLDILLDVQHGRDTVYEAADRIEAMASTPSAEVSTWNAALLAALAVVDPDEAALGPAYVFRVVKNRIRSLLKPTGGETAPARQTEQSLYCELAVSEIPGFGTNRYTHGCAKLHRGNASRAAACSGVTSSTATEVSTDGAAAARRARLVGAAELSRDVVRFTCSTRRCGRGQVSVL